MKKTPSIRMMRVILWTLLFVYVSILLLLTHVPKPPGVFDGYSDKSLHFLAYLVLGAVAYAAVAMALPRVRALALVVLIVGVVFAACDEITQPWFGRSSDPKDWIADAFGLLAAVSLMGLLRFFVELRTRRARPTKEIQANVANAPGFADS